MDTKVRPNLLHHWRLQRIFALLFGLVIGFTAKYLFNLEAWGMIILGVSCVYGADYLLERLLP